MEERSKSSPTPIHCFPPPRKNKKRGEQKQKETTQNVYSPRFLSASTQRRLPIRPRGNVSLLISPHFTRKFSTAAAAFKPNLFPSRGCRLKLEPELAGRVGGAVQSVAVPRGRVCLSHSLSLMLPSAAVCSPSLPGCLQSHANCSGEGRRTDSDSSLPARARDRRRSPGSLLMTPIGGESANEEGIKAAWRARVRETANYPGDLRAWAVCGGLGQ
ncbi:hypothetical protein SKAU_G00351440 [Synaphobranchus kaupii]|uniref:Uncharacterized protein n=1 Tax=Synaphobranchus kaupii TaxID=118154 RepID=A0A9Q1EKG1_SYNKA|nr:hypothetical protein SKAU_G00351440 [Synaphobranchus kaupii]